MIHESIKLIKERLSPRLDFTSKDLTTKDLTTKDLTSKDIVSEGDEEENAKYDVDYETMDTMSEDEFDVQPRFIWIKSRTRGDGHIPARRASIHIKEVHPKKI